MTKRHKTSRFLKVVMISNKRLLFYFSKPTSNWMFYPFFLVINFPFFFVVLGFFPTIYLYKRPQNEPQHKYLRCSTITLLERV